MQGASASEGDAEAQAWAAAEVRVQLKEARTQAASEDLHQEAQLAKESRLAGLAKIEEIECANQARLTELRRSRDTNMEDMRCQLEDREDDCHTQETAVTDGFDCCCVGFLPHQYVPDAAVYDGVLCQVIEVFGKDDPSCAISDKWKKHKGIAPAMVISQLNGQVLSN
jgi:hypothetical protein